MSHTEFFKVKYQLEIYELQVLHPYAFYVFAHLVKLCYENKFPAPMLTSIGRTEEENIEVEAISDTHVTLRAFDISSVIYSKSQINMIVDHFNNHPELKQYAALNNAGEIRLAIFHKTPTGMLHFHFQVAKRYSLPKWEGFTK